MSHTCEKCRFSVEKDGSQYCLAFLKALYMNDYGEYVPVSDCIDCKEVDKHDK